MLTMADMRTNLTQQVVSEVRNYFAAGVFETIVPRSVKISEAPSFGKPITLYDPNSKGAKAYRSLADEMMIRFGLKSAGLGKSSQSAVEEKAAIKNDCTKEGLPLAATPTEMKIGSGS